MKNSINSESNKLKPTKLAIIFLLIIMVISALFFLRSFDAMQAYKMNIESNINESSEFDIKIGAISLKWGDFTPIISVESIKFNQARFHTNIILNDLILELSLFDSVMTLKPVITDLSVEDINVEVKTPSGVKELDLDGSLNLEIFKDFQRVILSLKNHKNKQVVSAILESRGDLLLYKNNEINGYLKISNLNLPHISADTHVSKNYLLAEGIKSEIWLHAKNMKKFLIQGNFDMTSFGAFREMYKLDIDELSGNLKGWYDLDAGGSFDFNNLSIIKDEISFKSLNGNITQVIEDEQREYQLSINELDIKKIFQFLDVSSFSQLDGFQRILKFSPKGMLNSVRVFQNNESKLLFSEVKNLSLEPFGGVPGIYGLDGYFQLLGSENQLDLMVEDTDGISFEFSNIFDSKLYFESLEGTANLIWDQNDHGLSEFRSLLDAKSKAGSTIIKFERKKDLKNKRKGSSFLSIGSSELDASKFEEYLPINLNRNLRLWLKRSETRGNLTNFSLIQKTSTVDTEVEERTTQLLLDMDDSYLSYLDDWPPIEKFNGLFLIEDKSFWGEIAKGSLSGLNAKNLLIRFDDSNDKKLMSVGGNLSGKMNKAISFIAETPMSENVMPILEWNYGGNIRSKINLEIPLVNIHDNQKHRKYDVSSEASDLSVDIKGIPITIDNISGVLDYSLSKGFHSKWINGNYKGREFNFKFLKDSSNQKVLVDTSIIPSTISEFLPYSWDEVIEGIVPLNGEIIIGAQTTRLDANDSAENLVTVTIESELINNTINLPLILEPFYDGTEGIALKFYFEPKLFRLETIFGNKTLADFRFDNGTLSRGLISYDRAIGLPSKGELLFAGYFPELDYLDFYTESATPDFLLDTNLIPKLDLKIDNAQLGMVALKNLKLSTKFLNNQSNSKFKSDWVGGAINVYHDNTTPVNVNLSYLDLSDKLISPENRFEDFDPRLIPNFDINIEKLSYNQNELGNLGFKFRTDEEKAAFKQIDGELLSLNLKSSSIQSSDFFWFYDGDVHRSKFSGLISIGKIEKLFDVFDVPAPLDSESGELSFSMNWDDKPWGVRKDNAMGELQINLYQGSFYNSSTGANTALKLVSLFNFANWLKRLRLDFSDVIDENLPYDHLSGSVKFNDGLAEFEKPLEMSMPSGRMAISGNIDILNETADATLIATLPVATNLPWLVALMGGVPAAAGVYITSKIIEEEMDRLSSIRYSLEGEWDELEVKAQEIFASKLQE